MAKDLERTLMKCKKCKKKTEHLRNTNKTGLLALIIHIALILVTAGLWLIAIIIYKLFTAKIGGWQCSECNS